MSFLRQDQLDSIKINSLLTSMSRPNSKSTDFPSRTEKAHGRCSSPSLICAECIRPRIRAVPTPKAIPAKRGSSNRMILFAS